MTARRGRTGRFLAAFLILLAASHAVRWLRGREGPDPAPENGVQSVELAAVELDGAGNIRRGAGRVRLAYTDSGSAASTTKGRTAPLVLLHGSPGSRRELARIAAALGGERRVLNVDLPGFGASTRRLANYSLRAHAAYVDALLEELGIPSADVLGFSMGGGVALEVWGQAPERVRSLVLLSAIGVQELELFGDYALNHLVHGAQLALVVGLREGLPHFGVLDGTFLGWPYARNFYDSDQRPLRALLQNVEPPVLILHGERDPLVPVAAALEHRRLVPQSELVVVPDGDHFLAFQRPEVLLAPLRDFLARVDAGTASRRGGAEVSRVAAAARDFDPAGVPPLGGIALTLFAVFAALGTLVSEDLTCIGVGALVGQGRVPFLAATLGCFVGIFVGDVLLFLAGRWLGRRALTRAPLSWFLTPARVEASSRWFEERGPWVIFASRFLPGARLPTYFAAGLLRTSFTSFAAWFALAAGIWTPLLVWISARLGGELNERVTLFRERIGLAALATVVVVWVVVKLGLALSTYRGRRLLVSRLCRLRRWEFWPTWLVYGPLVPLFVRLGWRHRSLFAFTAANPAMPAGGVVGESKWAILQGLGHAAGHMPKARFLPRTGGLERARELARELGYPVVVKPDIGERGAGVVVVRRESELDDALAASAGDRILQEYVPGPEYGIFYVRHPDQAQGRIFSLAEKRLVVVEADGVRTIERLILDDPRAVCSARFFLQRNAARLGEVPPAGERVALGELGTHCRGAVFLACEEGRTDVLEAEIDRVSRGYEGFFFGRYDVRADSLEDLRQGRFRILELNGVTSESADAYDPSHGYVTGLRAIARQWREAYAIGAKNILSGHPATGALALLRAWLRGELPAPVVGAPAGSTVGVACGGSVATGSDPQSGRGT